MERTPEVPHVPGNLTVYVFHGEGRADEAFRALQSVEKHLTTVKLGNLAIVRRGASGIVTFHESSDLPNRNRVTSLLPFAGVMAGLAARARGLLKTTRGTAALVGGGLGIAVALAIYVVDLGFADDVLLDLGKRLDIGTSVLVVLDTPTEEPL